MGDWSGEIPAGLYTSSGGRRHSFAQRPVAIISMVGRTEYETVTKAYKLNSASATII